MKPVGIGIVGCGVIGSRHIEAAAKSEACRLVAVADLLPERARTKAAEYFVPRVYDNAGSLFDDGDVEAVVLAMPTCSRTALALEAFAKGKHVLTEKPIAMNRGEVEAMIEARGSLVAACCSSRYRFTDSARAATGFIAAGHLGEIRVVHCRCLMPAGKPPEKQPPEWRLKHGLNGGGIFVNWGCYDLDYLLGLTGWKLQPRTAFAHTWPVAPHLTAYAAPGSDAETHLVAVIRCENGSVISYERGEFMPAQIDNAWTIVGTTGTLHLWMTTGAHKKIVFDRSNPETGIETTVVWEGEDDNLVVHNGPVHDLALAVRESRSPLTTFERGLVVQRITDAVYASAQTGGSVDV